jgi:hypothetical protein
VCLFERSWTGVYLENQLRAIAAPYVRLPSNGRRKRLQVRHLEFVDRGGHRSRRGGYRIEDLQGDHVAEVAEDERKARLRGVARCSLVKSRRSSTRRG